MDLGVAGFEWDAGNRGKCQKHGVPISLIERMFRGPLAVFPDPKHSDVEERLMGIGRSDDGRGVPVVFTLRERRGERFIRPISARYMHRREMDHYETEASKAGQ